MQGLYTESTTIVPPVFTDAYQQGLCESCAEHDPEQAKSMPSRPDSCRARPSNCYNTGAGHEEWVQAVGQQLQETLGWRVDLQGTPFTQFLDSQQDPGATGLFRFAWAPTTRRRRTSVPAAVHRVDQPRRERACGR